MRKKRWGVDKERKIKEMLDTAKSADDASTYLQRNGFDCNEINLILQRFYSKSPRPDGSAEQRAPMSANEQQLELIGMSQSVNIRVSSSERDRLEIMRAKKPSANSFD